jgi:hypothetical protein
MSRVPCRVGVEVYTCNPSTQEAVQASLDYTVRLCLKKKIFPCISAQLLGPMITSGSILERGKNSENNNN